MRVVIELKRDAVPEVVLNQLYKLTPLQDSFGVIMLAIVDGRPKLLSSRTRCRSSSTTAARSSTRRTVFDLRKAEERLHILEGLKIALDHLDAVIALIRAAAGPGRGARRADAAVRALSELQAQAILDMRLQRLTGLERDKILEEHAEIAAADRALPGDPRRRARGADRSSSTSCGELASSSTATRGAPRSSTRRPTSRIEDLIAEEDMVVTISHEGYIKRNPVAAVPRAAARRARQDRRDDQGRGLRRAPLRRLDARLHPVLHHQRQGVLAQGPRAAAGRAAPRAARPIVNLLSLRRRREDLRLPARCASSQPGHYVFFATQERHGEEDRPRWRTPTRARRASSPSTSTRATS